MKEVRQTPEFQELEDEWATDKRRRVMEYSRQVIIHRYNASPVVQRSAAQSIPDRPFEADEGVVLHLKGWRGPGSLLTNGPLVTRKMWIAEVKGEDFAQTAIDYLAKHVGYWQAVDGLWHWPTFGPRFGYRQESNMETSASAVIRSDLKLLYEGGIPDKFGRIAQALLPHLDRLLGSLDEGWGQSDDLPPPNNVSTDGVVTPASQPSKEDRPGGNVGASQAISLDYVTLDQVAPFANRSKRTLERYKGKGMPEPEIRGGGRGKPDLWKWTDIRPWIEGEFGVKLPEHFPDRFRH